MLPLLVPKVIPVKKEAIDLDDDDDGAAAAAAEGLRPAVKHKHAGMVCRYDILIHTTVMPHE